MRKADDIVNQGRNDPRDPKQKREHPYDFVSFPEGGKKTVYHKRFEHTKEEGYAGKLIFKIEVKSPLHIGSGLYQLSEDAGFEPGQVVRGIVTSSGKPVIPGSSLKGASRSFYEAITKSCLRVYASNQQEKIDPQRNKSKLPHVFLKDFDYVNPKYGISVILDEEELTPVDTCKEITSASDMNNNLCPACALFGSMGYQGRLIFCDAKTVTECPKDNSIAIPYLTNPQMHRAGKINVLKGKKILIDHIEGRKFYYKSDLVPGTQKNGNELIDYIPSGSVLEFDVIFKNCSEEELGGILYSFGVGEDLTYRIGGGKPIGLGEVKIELNEVEYHKIGRERFISFTGNTEKLEDIPSWINNTKEKFRKWDCYYPEGLEQILKIVNTLQDINTI
jgi:CRISPR/Cas system CSM-associated protein Csm3 (group 7 of RAMP superfamily)